jgi:hypothetical protein
VAGRASSLASLALLLALTPLVLAACGGGGAGEDAPALLGTAIPAAAPSALGVDLPGPGGPGRGLTGPGGPAMPKLPKATQGPLTPPPTFGTPPAPPSTAPGAGSPGGMQL